MKKHYLLLCNLCLFLLLSINNNTLAIELFTSPNRTHKTNYITDNSEKFFQNIKIPEDYLERGLEESTFLEDIEFNLYREGNKIIASGRKLFTSNKLDTSLFDFDNVNLMKNRGICHAKLLHIKEDLNDDGLLNYSNVNTKDPCVPKNKLKFTIKNINFEEMSYNSLEEWHGDDFKDAIFSFLNTCKDFNQGINKEIKSEIIQFGRESDWKTICRIAEKYYQIGFHKLFFERYFTPFLISDQSQINNQSIGKFTGYYIHKLKLSKTRQGNFIVPIYQMPIECKNQTKCYTRKEIYDGILVNKGLEVAWTDNLIDLFQLQIQGSGLGIYEDGKIVRLNFDGKNNQNFKSIYTILKENPNISAIKKYQDSIKWMEKFENIQEVLNITSLCDSYVFFQISDNFNVNGAQSIPLTQSRSVAVDTKYIPLGLPIWIETLLPIQDVDAKNQENMLHFNRLWIAQDTGSAIQGPIRGDLYMGNGPKGEYLAKHTSFPGKWFVLVPNAFITDTILNTN